MASIDCPNSDTDSPYTDNGRGPRSLATRNRLRTFADHLTAAKALTAHLNDLRVRHAYIGGFAWALLGSVRPTEMSTGIYHLGRRKLTAPRLHDIDVLIVDKNIKDLRDKVMDLDPRFADENLKFYYVTEEELDEHVARMDLLRNSRNNVHVDTLPAGEMGLPQDIKSTLSVGEARIPILHPAILVLTKFKRWSVMYTSTRPKSIKKVASDRADMQFIIELLAEQKERIRFHEYEGKTKLELLAMVRRYHDKYVDDVGQMAKLQSIMPDDWEDMLALHEPKAETSIPP